jgi:hypothetical protein
MAFSNPDSKGGPGKVYPDGADVDTAQANWSRTAPLITGQEVKDKHLFGIDLISGMMDSVTKRRQVFTVDMINDKIDDAVATAELETGLTIMPFQMEERLDFDRHHYNSFGYMRLKRRPCMSVEELSVFLANDTIIYDIPLDWVSVGHLHQGTLNLVPLTIALAKQGAQIPTSTAASAVVLTLLNNQPWSPCFFRCLYTAGFNSGQIPKPLNDLIGTIVAQEVLSMLLATYAKNASASLSIDGLSQSSSTNIQLFTQRGKDLADKRKVLTRKLKVMYGTSFFSGEV